MPNVIKPSTGYPCMSELSEEQLALLSGVIKTVDRNLELDTLDYVAGTISVSITYNRGTDSEWVKHDFITVNVACDSVPAIFKDVFGKVYDRCMH